VGSRARIGIFAMNSSLPCQLERLWNIVREESTHRAPALRSAQPAYKISCDKDVSPSDSFHWSKSQKKRPVWMCQPFQNRSSRFERTRDRSLWGNSESGLSKIMSMRCSRMEDGG
jgi:hypothetical protein